MNEIFEKTLWWLEEVVVEKPAESSALRESGRVVADRKRWAIIVNLKSLLFAERGDRDLFRCFEVMGFARHVTYAIGCLCRTCGMVVGFILLLLEREWEEIDNDIPVPFHLAFRRNCACVDHLLWLLLLLSLAEKSNLNPKT